MDRTDIVELGAPPRDRTKVARWANSVAGILAKLKEEAEQGRATLYYFDDGTRRAFAKLGELGGTPVSLEIRSQEARPGVKLILHEGSRERPLLVLSGQIKELAKGLLNLAERQHESAEQKLA